jgi:hypothetical protein
MPQPRMYLGEVPEDVYKRELEAYKVRRAESPDKKVRAQFNYNGINYTIQKGGSGYQLKHSAERVQKHQRRIGRQLNQSVALSSIEQMMVDNIYEEANKRGLHVDHKIPLAAGGPANAPWNLGLMTEHENTSKGDRQGGSWRYQPLLDSAGGAIKFAAQAVLNAIPKPVNGNGNGNGNGKKNGNEKPNGKPNGNVSPALDRGVIKSSRGSVSFAFEPSTRSVDTGLHGPHIFLP